MTDPEFPDLAMRPAQQTTPKPEEFVADKPTNVATEKSEPDLSGSTEPEDTSPYSSLGQTRAVHKEKKAADDLAAMIVADLRKTDGCPARGLRVTVYGSNPWNSWLSFGPATGPIPNKVELQQFCDVITERLKRLYDNSG